MKKIIALVALSVALSACDSGVQESPEQLSIQAVYTIDASIPAKSKSAAEVVAKLRSVRLVGCPVDFVDAYKSYIKSWDKLAELEKKMYSVNMQKATSDMANFISDYSAKPIDAAVTLKKEWPSYSKEIDAATSAISKAFVTVTSVGAKYNAVYKSNNSMF